MDEYLRSDGVCDFDSEAVTEQARQLAAGADNALMIAERCFTFVRDEIRHSFDAPYDGGAAVACAASEVLEQGHGICYAKSHLLSALLRANGIPAGFDYQRLDDGEGGFVLHGINTYYLDGVGWSRVDARGNGVSWSADGPGECNYHLNLATPLAEVVAALRAATMVDDLQRGLPTSVRMG